MRQHIWRGESLSQLSAIYKVPVCMLDAANRELFRRRLVQGDKINIPALTYCSKKKDNGCACEREILYFVKEGDILFSISEEMHVPMWHIMQRNGIKHPAEIKPGMALRIPAENRDTQMYVVKFNESLHDIANEFHVPVEKIQALNLGIKDVYPGMQIFLPDKKTV